MAATKEQCLELWKSVCMNFNSTGNVVKSNIADYDNEYTIELRGSYNKYGYRTGGVKVRMVLRTYGFLSDISSAFGTFQLSSEETKTCLMYFDGYDPERDINKALDLAKGIKKCYF